MMGVESYINNLNHSITIVLSQSAGETINKGFRIESRHWRDITHHFELSFR